MDQWQQQDEAWKADPALPKPSDAALWRQPNAIKRDVFPLMLDVTKNALQMAIIHLGQAFKNFFAGTAAYPTFKKKGRHDRFTPWSQNMKKTPRHLARLHVRIAPISALMRSIN